LVIVIRRKRYKLTFRRPFSVKGIDRLLSPGDYELVPDHEMTAEPYFPAYREVVTMILVPPEAYRRSSIVKANVDSAEIFAAHRREQSCD
jgi:hypothetical protein